MSCTWHLKAALAYDEIAGPLGRPVNGIQWSAISEILKARTASRASAMQSKKRKEIETNRKASLYDQHRQEKGKATVKRRSRGLQVDITIDKLEKARKKNTQKNAKKNPSKALP
eukprot:SAG31_NODE_3575_length_4110_cov_2.432560_4_plen_114_part_00